MTKSKPELIDDLIRTAELISDAMDDLQIPHIFITLKTTPPCGIYFCNGGAFLQSFFLALTALIKTIETQPLLWPVLKTLHEVLDNIQKRHEEDQAKRPPEPPAEGMTELTETLKEIFERAEKERSPGE